MVNELSEPFFGEIRETAVGTFEVTIPIRTIKFEGWQKGDTLKITATKLEPKKTVEEVAK